MRNHKDLRAWHHARDVASLVYACTKAFPRSEEFGLAAQMRRSAISVVSNIAEGAARRSNREFGRFLEIALGFAAELHAQIDVARLLGLGDDRCLAQAEEATEDVKKMLSGLLRAVRGRFDSEAGRRKPESGHR